MGNPPNFPEIFFPVIFDRRRIPTPGSNHQKREIPLTLHSDDFFRCLQGILLKIAVFYGI